jgi:hypothetical protein
VYVRGVVVDSAGSPIPDVSIDDIAAAFQTSTTTNGEGHFNFETRAPAIIFRKGGWKSQLVRLSSLSSEARVVLERGGEADPLPICSKKAYCVTTGGIFCLPKMRGVSVGDRPYTIDTFEREFTIESWFGPQRTMMHGTGTSWGGPEPRTQEIWNSVEFSETQRAVRGYSVLDAHGKTSDGKLWRSSGRSGESIFYYGQDGKDAALFDRMLDGLGVVPAK